MGGGFPVSDGARDNNHGREITMLIFVAPQGVVWLGYPSSEGPHITKRPMPPDGHQRSRERPLVHIEALSSSKSSKPVFITVYTISNNKIYIMWILYKYAAVVGGSTA